MSKTHLSPQDQSFTNRLLGLSTASFLTILFRAHRRAARSPSPTHPSHRLAVPRGLPSTTPLRPLPGFLPTRSDLSEEKPERSGASISVLWFTFSLEALPSTAGASAPSTLRLRRFVWRVAGTRDMLIRMSKEMDTTFKVVYFKVLLV